MAETIQGTNLESGQIGTTVADDINYRTLGESFSDAIKLGMTTADDRANEITEAQEEVQKVWDENNLLASTNGDYLNTRVVKLAEEGSLQLQTLSKMYSKGEITRNKYLTQKNNILNSAKQLTSFINNYQDMRNKGLKAAQPGSLNAATGLPVGSKLNTYNQDKLGAAAQLENHGFFLANDGKIFFQQYDQNGQASNNINDFKTMPGALNASIQEYQNLDLTQQTASVAEVVKPFIRVVGAGKIKTREDAMKEPKVKAYVENKWKELKYNSEYMMSIITSQGVDPPTGYNSWDFTEDPAEAANDPSKILIRIDGKSDRFVAVSKNDKDYIAKALSGQYTQKQIDAAIGNYDEGVKKAEKVFKNSVASQLGIKEEYKAPAEQKEWQWKAGKDRESKLNNISLLDRFYRSNEGGYAEATKALQNTVVVTGEGGNKKEVKLLELSRPKGTDGVVTMTKEIFTFDENGNKGRGEKVTDTIDMGKMTNRQFINAYYTFMYGEAPDQSAVNSMKLQPKFGPSQEDNISKSRKIQSKTYAELPNVQFNDITMSPSVAFEKPVSENATKVKLDSYNAIVMGGLDSDIDFSGYIYDPAKKQITFTYNGKEYSMKPPVTNGMVNINGGQMETIYKMMAEDGELRGTFIYDKFGTPITQ